MAYKYQKFISKKKLKDKLSERLEELDTLPDEQTVRRLLTPQSL